MLYILHNDENHDHFSFGIEAFNISLANNMIAVSVQGIFRNFQKFREDFSVD